MKQKNGAAPVAAETTPKTTPHANGCDPHKNVAQSFPFVKYGRSRAEQLRWLHFSKGVAGSDIVETVQAYAPKFGKSELSKTENPESYGIEISKDALTALWLTYAPDEYEMRKRTGDGHRLSKRLSCRVEDNVYTLVQCYVKAEHMDVDTFLNKLIRDYFMLLEV